MTARKTPKTAPRSSRSVTPRQPFRRYARGSNVWVLDPSTGRWSKATVDKEHAGNGVVVRDNKSGRLFTVAFSRLMMQKRNGKYARRSHKDAQTTSIKSARVVSEPGGRPARFRAPSISMHTCFFEERGAFGDYGWMLEQPSYARSLCIYNENVRQQRDKSNNLAGGGNAVARPYRPKGTAIGVPTGEHGGFKTLNDILQTAPNQTAKDAIDEAVNEIVEHILANPDRFDRFYYCINKPPHGYQTKPSFEDWFESMSAPCEIMSREELKAIYDNGYFDQPEDKLIGTGIFHIGDDVREYITQRLRRIPSVTHKTYRARRYSASAPIAW